jgi:predicted transposase YdaD
MPRNEKEPFCEASPHPASSSGDGPGAAPEGHAFALALRVDTTSFDILTKTLVIQSRVELVAWLSGYVPLAVEIEATDLVQTRVRVSDQILRASFPPTAPGGLPCTRRYHIEFQTAGDQDMDLRMAEYYIYATRYFLEIEKRRVMLSSAVIYLDRKQYRPDPGEFRTDDGEGTSDLFRYRVVKLWEHEPSTILSLPSAGLAPLAPLMKTKDPVRTVVESKQKILGAEPLAVGREKKIELCGALFALAGLVIDDRDLLFKLIWEDWMGLERSVTVQWLMERGAEKGVVKGLLDARRDAVVSVLESRFGAVDEGLQSRIHGILDAEELQKLLRWAASAASLEAFLEALA